MVHIPVLGEIYSVSFTKLDALGECDNFHCTIKLAEDLLENEEACWRVLRHELGHAFVFETGLGDYMLEREQEMMAQLIGNFLNLFAKPIFFKNLLNEAKESQQNNVK